MQCLWEPTQPQTKQTNNKWHKLLMNIHHKEKQIRWKEKRHSNLKLREILSNKKLNKTWNNTSLNNFLNRRAPFYRKKKKSITASTRRIEATYGIQKIAIRNQNHIIGYSEITVTNRKQLAKLRSGFKLNTIIIRPNSSNHGRKTLQLQQQTRITIKKNVPKTNHHHSN